MNSSGAPARSSLISTRKKHWLKKSWLNVENAIDRDRSTP
ncbi:hypothetical protein CES86_1189 [Brucella lupini]|uniref:Uncharacterized protein n=1 Tax=Brucella lupini TaxID=255457 RepID=A0A256GVT1_9HYPH|nr:hypothetical protein CES86_1189 [Brucella lupini]